MSRPTKIKDPSAVLDYVCDLAALTNGRGRCDWLAAGETVLSANVTSPGAITVDSFGITDAGTSVTAWVSGGTVGGTYPLEFTFTTSDARTDQRTMFLRIEER